MEYKIKEKLFGANKRSASGTSLTLNDTVKYPINKLTIDGVCEQKTRSGKNLFRGLTLSLTNNGLTSTYSDINSNEVTINGTSTKNWANISSSNKEILPVGTYTLSINKIQSFDINIKGIYEDDTAWQYSISKGDTTITFTAIMNVKMFYIFISDSTNFTANTTFKIELNEGSTASNEFDQYGASPSPDYPQEIKTLTGNLKLTSCGKNLLKLINADYSINGINANVENGIVTLNGTPSNGTSLLKISNFNYVFKANTTYSLNVNPSYFIESAEARLRLANNNGRNVVKDFYFTSRENKVSFSFSANTKVTELWIRTGTSITYNDLVLKPQLNFGQPTSFEPYQDSSLNITIPENEFVGKLDDTYKDTLNIVYKDDGHYHLILNKIIGKITLDGSETITKSGATTNEILVATMNVNGLVDGHGISNYFMYSSHVGKNKFGIYNNGKNLRFCLDIQKFATIDDFKSWLSAHNTEVCYLLETPYEIDLGIVDQLLTFDEITNIFSDSDLYPVINVKYYNGSLDISNYEFSIKEV